VVIIFDEPPRYREVQSKPESKHPMMKAYRDRASSRAETREETRPRTRSAVAHKHGCGFNDGIDANDSLKKKEKEKERGRGMGLGG